MNPTPVAWMDADGCLIADTTHPQNYTALFTESKLRQAKADALREAARMCKENHGTASLTARQLLALADEIEGEKNDRQ